MYEVGRYLSATDKPSYLSIDNFEKSSILGSAAPKVFINCFRGTSVVLIVAHTKSAALRLWDECETIVL